MSAISELQGTTVVNLADLLDAGDGAVVTLSAGDTRLAAHRAVLSSRSPVFATMFQRDTLEASKGHISITDMEGSVLRHLLAYMYTLQAPHLTDMATPLLVAADKYGLSALKAVCEQQVAAQLAIENAAAVAVLAVRHSCPSLTAAAIDFIRAHRFQVMATQGWADAVCSHPEDVTTVTRLLNEATSETRMPATAEAKPAPSAHHQPHSGHSRHTPAAVTAPTVLHHAPPPDAATPEGGPSPSTNRQPHSGHSHHTPATVAEARAPHHVPPPDALNAEGGATPGTQEPHSVHGRHSPATVAAPTAQRHAPPPDAVTAEGRATPSTQEPHSGHGHHSPASVAAPTAPHHAPPPDDATVSWMRTLSVQQRDKRLIQAAQQGALWELRALLAAGADVRARDKYKQTALHWAAERGHVEVARCLVGGGAEVDARSSWLRTPLHLAALWGHAAVARLLLAASADPNARDQWGSTPLHWAAVNGRADVAVALLGAGADRGSRDVEGNTPLNLARQNNKHELIGMLT